MGTIYAMVRIFEHLLTRYAIKRIFEHYLIDDADLLPVSVPGHAAHHALVPVVDHLLVPRALQNKKDFPHLNSTYMICIVYV